MRHIPWIITVLIVFFIGAYSGTKWPQTNVVGKIV